MIPPSRAGRRRIPGKPRASGDDPVVPEEWDETLE